MELLVALLGCCRYYYGLNDLFKRHPDMVEILTQTAPARLTCAASTIGIHNYLQGTGVKEGNVYWPILVGRAAYFGAVQVFFISVSIYFGDASGVKIHQPGAFAHDVGWNDLEAWSGESKNRTRRPLLWGRRISMLRALDFILSVAPIPVDLHGVPVVVAKPSPKPWLSSVALVQYPKAAGLAPLWGACDGSTTT